MKIFLFLFSLIAFVSGQSRPNVVIVITDDQGYGDLACHGNPVIKTPNLDKLYSESTVLTDYHVAPTCSPTRAALLSEDQVRLQTNLGRVHVMSDHVACEPVLDLPFS